MSKWTAGDGKQFDDYEGALKHSIENSLKVLMYGVHVVTDLADYFLFNRDLIPKFLPGTPKPFQGAPKPEDIQEEESSDPVSEELPVVATPKVFLGNPDSKAGKLKMVIAEAEQNGEFPLALAEISRRVGFDAKRELSRLVAKGDLVRVSLAEYGLPPLEK